MNTSHVSRPTYTYRTAGSYGTASNGRWLFKNRWCSWASMVATTDSTSSRKAASIHGDNATSGAGKGPGPKTSRLMMRCIQVVPAFIEVEMTTSPGRRVT